MQKKNKEKVNPGGLHCPNSTTSKSSRLAFDQFLEENLWAIEICSLISKSLQDCWYWQCHLRGMLAFVCLGPWAIPMNLTSWGKGSWRLNSSGQSTRLLPAYRTPIKNPQFSLGQFSCSVVSDFLWPQRGSTSGFLVHHQLPEFTQTHVHWVSDAIQSSHPLSSPSPPAFNLSQHQGLS